MKPKTIIILVLLLLSLVILVQNTQVVTLRVLFWHMSMSRILLIPLLLLIGFVIGYLVAALRRKKAGSETQ
jgi:putative membrane protein